MISVMIKKRIICAYKCWIFVCISNIMYEDLRIDVQIPQTICLECAAFCIRVHQLCHCFVGIMVKGKAKVTARLLGAKNKAELVEKLLSGGGKVHKRPAAAGAIVLHKRPAAQQDTGSDDEDNGRQ